MGKHAEYSASQADKWVNCTGYMGMKDFCPPDKQSPAAAEGTAAHELLEMALKEGIDAWEMAEILGGKVIIESDTGEELTFIADENMTDAVQECIDLVAQIVEEHPDCEVVYEQHVDISELVDHPETFGTVDVRISVPFHELFIIDYKHGSGVPVEVEENKQLLNYALGSAALDDFDFEKIHLIIVQPRCPHPNGSVRWFTTTPEELEKWRVIFKNSIKTSEAARQVIHENGGPVPELVNAGSWCKFCPAAADCPARHQQTIEMAQLEFDDEEDMYMPTTEVDDLTMEQMVRMLKSEAVIRDYLDKVYERVHNMMERGVEVPGLKLIKKRAYAKFTDDEEIVIDKLVDLGYDQEIITRTKLETITKLRKICGKELIDESLTHIPDTGTKVALEDAPGVA